MCDHATSEAGVTMLDVLKEEQTLEENAVAVLGGSDDKFCTYSEGYIKRQAIYACMTCTPDAVNDDSKRAGVCLACSYHCHEKHKLFELYTKRNFRCDCGGPKFGENKCALDPFKNLSELNSYNQNFSGLYCICNRPYPDDEDSVEDEMIQCAVCEDWYHGRHLGSAVPVMQNYSEMICAGCMKVNDFLSYYAGQAVNVVPIESASSDKIIDVENKTIENIENDSGLSMSRNAVKHLDNSIENKALNKDNVTESQDDQELKFGAVSTLGNITNDSSDIKEGSSTTSDTINEVNSEDNTAKSSLPIKTEGLVVDDFNSINDNQCHVAKLETDAAGLIGLQNAEATNEILKIVGANVECNIISEITNHNLDVISTNETKINQTSNDIHNDVDVEVVGVGNLSEDCSMNTSDEYHNTTVSQHISTNQNTEKCKTNQLQNDIENNSITMQIDVNSAEKNVGIIEQCTSSNQIDLMNNDCNNTRILEENADQDHPIVKQESSEINEDRLETSSNAEKRIYEATNSENEEDNIPNKKQKSGFENNDHLDVTLKKGCIKPTTKVQSEGAVFWPENWRTFLCTCLECTTMYKALKVSYLLDNEDTVQSYEDHGKSKNVEGSSQYEKGMRALFSLGHVQQVDALTEYNNMLNKLKAFLRTFAEKNEIVKEEDVKVFFDTMKAKQQNKQQASFFH